MKITRASDYPSKPSVLINGEMVVFKLMTREDCGALLSFFSRVPDHEAEMLRHDVRDPAVICRWVDHLDYGEVFPLIAWNETLETITAVATLHYKKGIHRHVADIRVFVGQGYRKLGLGSAIIKELVDIGTRQGLYFLQAEVLTENQLALRAFKQLGFEYKCTLEEYFMSRRKRTYDVALLLKRLRFNMEEDFFYLF
ncbi:MAG TPA: GNAT family N-acetyltransferase [Syntrophobacteraceae bacterium]|nr:GNAT family N-acetyltransferase [Syntrophobacteraceae bacterium]